MNLESKPSFKTDQSSNENQARYRGNPLRSHPADHRQALALADIGVAILPLASCVLGDAQHREPANIISIGCIHIARTATYTTHP